MPPKNYTPLDGSLMFLKGPDGVRPFSDFVEAVEVTEERPELDILGDTPRYIVPQTGEFTADVLLTTSGQRLLTNMAQVIQPVWNVVSRVMDLWQSYPNKRVKHLALHAKKPRTRKKNLRRIARWMLKEAKHGTTERPDT